MYHGDLVSNANDCSSITSPSSTLCGEPFAYNPHSGMYIKLGGQTYITHVSSINRILPFCLRLLIVLISLFSVDGVSK